VRKTDGISLSRSVYERALDVDHRNIGLWLKYTEMEMRNKQVNHARNLWDRAVTILPRANQFWYKYTYMEEMLNHIAGQVLFSSYAGTVLNVCQEKPFQK
jgi:crooked neck